jgi:hypothetical protein
MGEPRPFHNRGQGPARQEGPVDGMDSDTLTNAAVSDHGDLPVFPRNTGLIPTEAPPANGPSAFNLKGEAG